MRLTFCALVVGVLFVTSHLVSNAQDQPIDPWQKLEYKMAWVLLAVLDGDRLGVIKAFEAIGKPAPAGGYILPGTGDRIRLLQPQDLVILGFSRTGETRRLESPTTVDRLVDDDYTKTALPLGSVVQVRKIELGRPISGLREVWVLVSPPDQK